MLKSIDELKDLTKKHTEYRGKCLNLIAAENLVSKTVRWYLTTDFGHRYNTFFDDPMKRNYLGQEFVALVETKARETSQKLFNCKHVELRPLGGQMAGNAVITALTKPGDVVFETPEEGGFLGHEVCARLISANLLKNSLEIDTVEYDTKTTDINFEIMGEKIKEKKPKLIICGTSQPLFPESLERLRSIADEVGAYIAYDASHVMGLIAGKQFFNPLDNGADVMMGSTHKTFPGPQGGIILSNNEEIFRRIRLEIYPPIVTNHHANRVASLGAAFLEMLEFGEAYHEQIIKNSQALGKALYDLGFKALYPEFNFSRSHVVLVDVKEFFSGSEAASLLQDANIITGITTTPIDTERGTKKNGLRIGTQEITRAGMKEKDMSEIALFFKRTLMDKENPKEVSRGVEKFTAQFNKIHYTWDDNTPAYRLIDRF